MHRPISRRRALAALGSIVLGAVAAACRGNGDEQASPGTTTTTPTGATTTDPAPGAAPALTPEMFDQAASCTLTPEQTAGPFYVDVDSIRRDIREDREGIPLRLGLRVRDAARCEPVEGAVVDTWHCDALGVYSGFDGDGGTNGATFLRGAQLTDQDGICELLTIYPGWYEGRTVHVHVKVHLDGATVLTSQLYFDDDRNAGVFEQEPYAQHRGRWMRNDEDGIFDERLVMTISTEGDGYLALETIDVATAPT